MRPVVRLRSHARRPTGAGAGAVGSREAITHSESQSLPLPRNLPYNKGRLIGCLGPPPSQTGGPNVSRSLPRSDQLESLFPGYGYKPHFVGGDDPATMHQLMAATLDIALDEIASIQRAARSGHDIVCPQWPMIVPRSLKGWTGPKAAESKLPRVAERSSETPPA